MKNLTKWILFVFAVFVSFSIFGEDAAQEVSEKGSVFWNIVHAFFVALSGVIVTAATLGVHALFKLVQNKWRLEGLEKIEAVAMTAVVNGIHYAENMAARKALDSRGVLKSTGKEKFDMAMQHVTEVLGNSFVQEYGIKRLEKLIESALAQNNLGPTGR